MSFVFQLAEVVICSRCSSSCLLGDLAFSQTVRASNDELNAIFTLSFGRFAQYGA